MPPNSFERALDRFGTARTRLPRWWQIAKYFSTSDARGFHAQRAAMRAPWSPATDGQKLSSRRFVTKGAAIGPVT
jgi:hypothetical protein